MYLYIDTYIYIYVYIIVRKGAPARPPPPSLTVLRHPPIDKACPPLLKNFFSPLLFSVPPPFKVF